MKVLNYHEIVPRNTSYLYHVSCAQFEEHLQVLEKVAKKPRTINPIVTFDDGHISHFTEAVPLLGQYSRKAIFFVTAGFIDKQPEFMSWSNLREMASLGHSIQAHGWSHVFLTLCPPLQLLEELWRSRMVLEDKLGRAVDAISMPGGRWNRLVLQACAEAGYKRVYTSDPWMDEKVRAGVQMIGRFTVNRKLNGSQLSRVLLLSGSATWWPRINHTAKELTRNLLGDRNYHRLWVRLSGWDEGERFRTG